LGLQVRNSGNEGGGLLNDGVGADFVQKEKVLPHGFQLPADVGKRYRVTGEVLLKLNQMSV
jgi:phosphoacetylglucosamine mutase